MKVGRISRTAVATMFASVCHMANAGISITELMADNGGCTNTADGVALDWIELYNDGDTDVDISGWRMIDDNTKKWNKWQILPEGTVVPAHGYHVVWGDNDPGFTGWTNGEIHVDIGLSSTKSEGAWLAQAEGDVVDGFTYPAGQFANVSYGRDPFAPNTLLYFANPTPGAQNGDDGVETYMPPPGVYPGKTADSGVALDERAQAALATGLVLVSIETVDGEEPACEYVTAPEGCVGGSITNAQKVEGRVRLLKGSEVLFDSGEYVKKKSGMTVKVRGNTSTRYDVYPYKIKLQKAADMLLRGDDARYADQNWVLLNTGDSLFPAIGFKVNELLGLDWTPGWQYVNVAMNGEYRGIYILVEAVERNSNCRLDVDGNEGAIFEYDAYWWNEDVYFKTSFCPYGSGFTFKYPDSDDVTGEHIAAISNVMENVYLSIQDGTYPDFIDCESWAAWLLGQDLLGNFDAAGSNIYLTKYDLSATSAVKMGNLWDFDGILATPDNWAIVHRWSEFLFPALIANTNQTFGRAYQAKWAESKDVLKTGLENFFYDMLVSEQGRGIAATWEMLGYGHTVVSDVFASIEWFLKRFDWIDGHIGELTPKIEDQASLPVLNVETDDGLSIFPPSQIRLFPEAFVDGAFAGSATYNAALYDASGVLAGTVQMIAAKAKNGESKLNATVKMMDGTRKTLKGVAKIDGGSVSGTGAFSGLVFGADRLSGILDGYVVEGARSLSKDKSAAALFNAFKDRVYGIVLTHDGMAASDIISVKFGAKGKAAVKIATADGKKISASGTLVCGKSACELFVASPKALLARCVLRFSKDAVLQTVDSFASGSTLVAFGAAGSMGADNAVFALDANRVKSLLPDVMEEYLPVGIAVATKGKWAVAGKAGRVKYDRATGGFLATTGNPSACKFTFKLATGVFTGSFSAYLPKGSKSVKKVAVTVQGVVLDGVGYCNIVLRGIGALSASVVRDDGALLGL